jgi:uncharacterized protein (DUF342 family)
MTDTAQVQPVAKNAAVTIQLSADKLTVSITGYSPPEGEGFPLDMGSLKEQIAAAGVGVPPIESAFLQVLNFIRIGRSLSQGIKVAEGTPPTAGADGRIEMIVDLHVSTGEVTKNGRIDYHHRGFVKSVLKGELLARIVPPSPGTPGTDVLGGKIPADDGRPANFTAGANVRVNEDGNIYSMANGMIQYVHNTLSVKEALEISGDVDFSTGDILMSEGSLRVHGTVRTGFKVQAAGDISVDQSIEDAEVGAGGNVKVEQGVVNGCIRCNGAASMKYGENAKIDVEGDINIEVSAYNCDITTRGKVTVVAGKGLIRGGIVRAAIAVEANEIGSDAIAGTQVLVGLNGESLATLLKEKQELEDQLMQFARKHGELDFEGSVQHLADAEMRVAAKALKNNMRLKRVNIQIEAEKKRMRDSSFAEIRVRKIIHQGTIVTIAGKSITLAHDVMNSRFFFDHEADDICWAPL